MKINFQKISRLITKSIWLVPFIAFGIGYCGLHFFITDTSIQAPDLVGRNILQATKTCSNLQLNLRIIAEKEIVDATPGTIIKQNPLPNTSIKNHQSIFIVVTKQPEPIVAPTLINKHQDQIEAICKEKNIKPRIYHLPSHLPAGQCFAQMPQADEILEAKKMSCYISMGNHNQYLFPDFTGLPLEEVIEFLRNQNMQFDVFYKDQKISLPTKQKFMASFQKPLAGTLIAPQSKLYVQLQVS